MADSGIEIPNTLAVDRARERKPVLLRVTENVYAACEFAISNVLFVVTNSSVVVIDTTEGVPAASVVLAEFRKVCQLPISYIIYTHFHGDHVGGAKVFHSPSTHIIAQRIMPAERALHDLLWPYHKRRTAAQFAHQFLKPGNSADEKPGRLGYLPPDIVFDDHYKFVEGGVEFELSHTQGETRDHLMVWLPATKVLFPGDLFYHCFPMLSSPMFPDRPVLAWAESIERMRALKPEHLVPSHSRPKRGAEDIDTVLSNSAEAIRFVHDETIKGINEGLPLEQIRARVRLPERLATLPYLREVYGTVAWAVNGIYRQYTGWYTFNPKDLDPCPRGEFCSSLLETCGSKALNERARQALAQGRPQLALELLDVVLTVEDDRTALALKAECLNRLAEQTKFGVARNVYRTALGQLRIPPEELKEPAANGRAPLAPKVKPATERPVPVTGAKPSRRTRPTEPITANPCFILAPPLCLSALLGAMLGQHPRMYGLPAIHLFPFETMDDWWNGCEQASFGMAQGLLRAVAQLEYGAQTEESVTLAGAWLRRRKYLSTGALLEALAQRVAPCILVDKSPSLAAHVTAMQRAFAMFPHARFIHLLRHPRAYCDAVMLAIQEAAGRGQEPEWLINLATQPPPSDGADEPPAGSRDPQWSWYALNRNILDFLGGVPAWQVFRLRGEDVLGDPDSTLRSVAAWLGLRDDREALDEMKHPERSPFACLGPVSATWGDDPAFLKSPALPAAPEATNLDGFASTVRQLALEVGYS